MILKYSTFIVHFIPLNVTGVADLAKQVHLVWLFSRTPLAQISARALSVYCLGIKHARLSMPAIPPAFALGGNWPQIVVVTIRATLYMRTPVNVNT
jgi:hypothetical protein